MYKKKKTYELEVHFGLLVLVVIMLSLNIISNYVIYSSRNILNEEINGELYKTSLSISRHLQNNQLTSLTATDKQQFISKYKLNNLIYVSSMPREFNENVKPQKINILLKEIPFEQFPYISKIVLTDNYYELSRGMNNIYYYVAPVMIGKSNNILVLSKDIHNLAYIDDASKRLTYISMIAILAITLIYILLFRFILSPFRKLKANATSAGRLIPSGNYEVDSVLNEYQIIIKELKEKESELVELHNEATRRADSFEQFNEYLLDSMQAGVITIDKAGEVLTINNSAEKMCDIHSYEFINANYNKLPFLSVKLRNRIQKTLRDKIYHSYEEYEFSKPSIKVGITISPVCDDATDQIGASILINDISEIKKLQEDLEKNRQMSALGEMSAGLAHQLRNSLGAIVGYNQLVKKRLSQNNIETSTVDSMASELNESENLIRRFLNFTKPFDYSPERENIIDFIEDVLNTLSVRVDFKKIKMNFNNNLHKSRYVTIDSLLLKQALTNIIENSKNAYNNNNGTIDITISEDENCSCLISIQDYASGIEKEHYDKIFTPFYSTNPSGTGLGLPLSQKVIALHDGNLKMESSVGEGTIFKIRIPFEQNVIPVNV